MILVVVPNGSSSDSWLYHIEKQYWRKTWSLPRNAYGATGIVSDDLGYVVGGYDNTGVAPSELTVSVYTPMSGWQDVATWSDNVAHHVRAVLFPPEF